MPRSARTKVLAAARVRGAPPVRTTAGQGQFELESERALRQSRTALGFVLYAGDLGAWNRDLQSGQFTATPKLREHFGLDPNGPPVGVATFLARIHPADRRRQIRALNEAIANHTILDSECRTVAANGEVRWLLVRGAAVYGEGGETVSVGGITMDITERKRLELTREQLIAELTASNEERAHFAHVASHDLREPLRMVESFCGLLATGYADKLDERGREFIKQAVSGAVRMRELVDDLVDYGRIGHEAERGVWFDASDSLARVLENLNEAIAESGARIEAGLLPRIYGNPIRFIRLMQNLVGNALKYVPAGAHPCIQVAAVAADGAWRFSVRDNGIGIEERHLKRVFEPFRRLHSKQTYPGTGLGLAICRKIVQGFGGEIWATSEPGRGSTFLFTIKIHNEEGDNDRPPR